MPHAVFAGSHIARRDAIGVLRLLALDGGDGGDKMVRCDPAQLYCKLCQNHALCLSLAWDESGLHHPWTVYRTYRSSLTRIAQSHREYSRHRQERRQQDKSAAASRPVCMMFVGVSKSLRRTAGASAGIQECNTHTHTHTHTHTQLRTELWRPSWCQQLLHAARSNRDSGRIRHVWQVWRRRAICAQWRGIRHGIS